MTYTIPTLQMIVKDNYLEMLINTHTPITIRGKEYYIEKSPIGSCDGCAFRGDWCPTKAVTICCSNGGNILKLKEQNNK